MQDKGRPKGVISEAIVRTPGSGLRSTLCGGGSGRWSDAPLACLEKGFGRDADVPRDLPKEDGREIAAGMERVRGLTAIRVSILPVGSALTDESEPEALEKPLDLPWLEHGKGTHGYATCTV